MLSRYMPQWSSLEDRRYRGEALERGEWLASRLSRALPSGKCAHCTGEWVSPIAGLDAGVLGKLVFLYRGSNSGRPVRSRSLYRLSCPGCTQTKHTSKQVQPGRSCLSYAGSRRYFVVEIAKGLLNYAKKVVPTQKLCCKLI
jgi:hypothetical protein